MAQNFLSCDRDQVMLLPPDMSEWLPAEHLARFVIETVGELDLSEIYGYYRRDGHGRPAHDPAMMTALVLYNYALGIRSSRVIERRCVEDVACRVISANRQPDHATIARFRARHQVALSRLFFAVLAMCREAGMVRVGTVAVDSTKLAANASLDANHTADQLRAEAERILQEAAETDAREDQLYGDKRGDELPDELADPRTRAGKIRELLDRVQAREREVESARAQMHARREEHEQRTGRRLVGRPPGERPHSEQRRRLEQKHNLTDPDSGIVRHRGMLMQGYNVQTAVADGQIIVAAEVTGVSSDVGQLAPTVKLAGENLARAGIPEPISEVVADAGYWHNEQVGRLRQQGLRVLVPPRAKVASSPERLHPAAQQMIAVLGTEEGKDAYRRRQQIVEPVFAHWKYIRGITRVLRRGKTAVQAEIDLIATTHNLLKLYRHTLASA
jgi:transposase